MKSIELRSAIMDAITDVWDRSKQIDDAADEVLGLIEALQSQDREDALRYRYLTFMLQQAYDGERFERDLMTLYCYISSQYKGDRTVLAEITWRDKSDEPIDLSEAIDRARRIEGNHEIRNR